MEDFRCKKCHKLLGKYLNCRQLEIKCPRCGLVNTLKQSWPTDPYHYPKLIPEGYGYN